MSEKRKTKQFGSLIVSWDFSYGNDVGILLVGEKKTGKDVEIINVFRGEEAKNMICNLMGNSNKLHEQ